LIRQRPVILQQKGVGRGGKSGFRVNSAHFMG
jgi:hypothetical protein